LNVLAKAHIKITILIMWIKYLPKGKCAVMPDCAVFDNWALANDYINTKK